MKLRTIVGMFLMVLLSALGITSVKAQDRFDRDYRYEQRHEYRHRHGATVRVYTTPVYTERSYRGYRRYHRYPTNCVRIYNGRRIYERCR